MAIRLRSLTEEEQKTITRWSRSRTEPARRVERATSIRLASEGQGVPQVAAELGLCDAAVRKWIKLYAIRRAGGQCEGCGEPAPFLTLEYQPYLEVHHIERLSDGGPDAPDAVVAICPNCHRRAHYAQDQAGFKAHLKQVVGALEHRA